MTPDIKTDKIMRDGKIMKGGESMSKEIKVNQEAVECNADAISGATQYFEVVALTPSDNRTTITANAKGQAAYAKSQEIKKSFGDAMKREASNIRSLGVTFQQYDEMLSELWENGFGKNE